MGGMLVEIPIGTRVELEMTVAREMCPHFDGVLVHPVLATWIVVHYMELAGRRVLVPFLDGRHEGVGAGITVQHRSPAALGATVRFEAAVESWDHRNLVCTTQAHCGRRVVAEGRFTQIVLEKGRLAALIERAREEAGGVAGDAGDVFGGG